jgi:hypothetical protein
MRESRAVSRHGGTAPHAMLTAPVAIRVALRLIHVVISAPSAMPHHPSKSPAIGRLLDGVRAFRTT